MPQERSIALALRPDSTSSAEANATLITNLALPAVAVLNAAVDPLGWTHIFEPGQEESRPMNIDEQIALAGVSQGFIDVMNRLVAGNSWQQTANELGVSKGTVWHRLKKEQKRLGTTFSETNLLSFFSRNTHLLTIPPPPSHLYPPESIIFESPTFQITQGDLPQHQYSFDEQTNKVFEKVSPVVAMMVKMHLDNYTLEDIGKALGLNRNIVKTRLRRADKHVQTLTGMDIDTFFTTYPDLLPTIDTNQIAVNLAHREGGTPLQLVDSAFTPIQQRELAGMDSDFFKMVKLRLSKLTLQQIGEKMGISAQVVDARLRRAKKKLTHTLRGQNLLEFFSSHQDLLPPNPVYEKPLVLQTQYAIDGQLFRDTNEIIEHVQNKYGTLIFSIAKRITGSDQNAEEVVNDVLLNIHTSIDTFHPQNGAFNSWIIGITRNRSVDQGRAKGQRQYRQETAELTPSLPAKESPVEDTVIQADQNLRVRRALVDLPASQRQVIELAFFAGLTQHEIAEALQEPLGTIKTRMRLAYLKLRALLTPHVQEYA